MKRFYTLTLTLLLFGLTGLFAQSTNPELAIGSSMPMSSHDMLNVDNSMVSVGDLKGDFGTVVVFWCNTCPWVAKYESRLISIAQTYGDRFGFIAINPNDPVQYPAENMAAMKVKAAGYPFAYVADQGSVVAAAYGAARTPHVFVFDENDLLVYVGGIDNNPNDASQVDKHYLTDALGHVIARTAGQIDPKTTRAFGCTIKWQTDS